MEVVMKKKKAARVERRGRFTITELEPDSPARSYAVDDQQLMFSGDGGDDELSGSGGDDDGGRRSFVRDSAAAAALMATERISPFGSAVFERSNGSVRVVDSSSVVGDSGIPGDSVTASAIGMETAVSDAAYDDSEPRDEHHHTPSNRRVKRKGRFTIIELSSDSPRSGRAALEGFSTTTSISVTSAQITQANAQNLLSSSPKSPHLAALSSSLPNGSGGVMGSERSPGGSAVLSRSASESMTTGSTSRRSSRSMVQVSNGVENGHRSERMRSVSPVHRGPRDTAHSYSSTTTTGSSHNPTPSRRPSYDMVNTSPSMKPMKSPAANGSSTNPLASSSSSVGGGTNSNNVVEKRQPLLEVGANRRHLASRQKAITISAEQFIQQQQTIASLIRQQQELKQLIGILQGQQQHLMTIPMHLSEFKLDQARTEAQEDTMREIQIQVTTLSRANDSLQTLLSQAENDAHEQTMAIECLSDENNELRHWHLILERKYLEERKHSLALEQDLQRTRRALYSARHKGDHQQQLHQKYQKKITSRSRDADDPLDQKLLNEHAAA